MRLHCLTIEIGTPGNAHIPAHQPRHYPRAYRPLLWAAGIFSGGWPWGDDLIFPSELWFFPVPARRAGLPGLPLTLELDRWKQVRVRPLTYSVATHFDWVLDAYLSRSADPRYIDLDTLPF